MLATQRLIFLDETSATTNMTPTRGRSLRGQRCPGFTPGGHWRTTTLVCALDAQGLLAPLVLDGPVNGAAFVAWVEQFLAPELRPGDIVVMDNLSSHKVVGVKQAIQSAGAELRYLPPYRPGLQPDRAGLCQAQNPAACDPGTNRRSTLERNRFIAQPIQPHRV